MPEPVDVAAVTAAEEAPGALPHEQWAGIQVTQGARKVPILGTIRSTTTALTLAEVVHDGDRLLFIDRPCQITVESSHGVSLSFDPKGMDGMPPVSFAFAKAADGTYAAAPWTGSWGNVDVDGDGVAGYHVRVETALCSGYLDVASRTESTAVGALSATDPGAGLSGTLDIALHRDVVAASNACLGLVDKHTDEIVSGTFRWAPVPPGSTCASLLASPWPVTAP